MRNVEDVLLGINIGIAAGLALSGNKENTLKLYEEIMSRSILPTDNLKQNLAEYIKEHAGKDFKEQRYNDAIFQYLDVFQNTPLEPEEYRNAGVCLIELNQPEAGKEFLTLYEKTEKNKLFALKEIGNIYFYKLHDLSGAIKYFEEFISKFTQDDEVYNMLGHLYSLYYKDTRLEKQKEYFLAAHNLKKNTRLYIRNLIFTLFRLGEYEEVEKYYQKLFKLTPEHADYYYYGCFLINQKRFKEGYTYLRHRFEKEGDDKSIIPAVLDKTKYWRGEPLERKKILVHCEQGFGDTIMYSRFVKDLAKRSAKVYFVVQDELFELINNSNLGVEVYSTKFGLYNLEYDYFTTAVDLPLYLEPDPYNLPYREGYLKSPAKEIVSNKKLKIGLAWHGNEKSKESARDIPFEELKPLFDIDDIEFYSLQGGEEVMPDNRLINAGKEFKTFSDTAKTIMGLDIVISTDNVILNLAGALGKQTFGLFNRYPEYRWYNPEEGTSSNWYESIEVFRNIHQDMWADTIKRVCERLNRIKEGFN